MGELIIYYQFEKDPSRKSKYNCTGFKDDTNRLRRFVNQKRFKGQLYLYLSDAGTVVDTSSRRMAKWLLVTCTKENFTSMYIFDPELPQFQYGYPDKRKPNLYNDDLYLFLVNDDYSTIELFIIPNARNFVPTICTKFLNGEYDTDIEELRNEAKPFFNPQKGPTS